ncbi:DNRLRE domain-containing protein [Streptomyces microflavus]|uniref:DNRLRE domain-containing protein n=1 Tax=Streptomyces microflavus TaxID=1919 RepID=UPI0033D78593
MTSSWGRQIPPLRSTGTARKARRIAVGLTAVLLAQTALVSTGSGAAFAVSPAGTSTSAAESVFASPGSAPAGTEKAASTADSVAAGLLVARLQKRRIEVLPERTATTTTYALPDGSLETALYAGPVRTRVDGRWKDIDTALVDSGPSLEPKVAAADVQLSDGGDKSLASVARGDHSFGMQWSTPLPTPEVKGDTASYDLGRGQTLTVTALSQGFSQNVVLDKPPATTPVYRIPLVLGGGLKLSKASTGRLLLKDTAGKLVAEAPAPMMWDASVNPASGESKHLAPVATTVETAADGAQTIVLKPDAAYFEQGLTYPVTVDPTSTLAASTDTWVATNYSDSQVSSTELKSGTYDAGTTKARSYLKFDVSPFKGKRVISSKLTLYSYYASTCATTGAGTQVRRVTSAWDSSAITWGAQPSTTADGAVTNKAALGYNSSCPAGDMSFDVAPIVRAWAAGSANHGLRIAGVSETDSTTWRRFRSANYVSGNGSTEPHLTVTYNSYPAVPTATTIVPSAVNSYNGRRYVTSLTPMLTAGVKDLDGSKTKAQFEITADPAFADTTYAYTATSAEVASGSTAKFTIPAAKAFPAGVHLRSRARAYDGTDYGPWTGYTTFTMNTGKPAAPKVSCETYEENGWTAKADGPVTCTLDTESTDGAGYWWGLDDPAVPHKQLDTTNGNGGDAAKIAITPGDGWHTLYAKTVDSGGNLSTASTAYQFGVGEGGAAVLSPGDGAETARRLTLAAKGLTSYTGVTWQYRRGGEDTWRTVPAADVTASGDAVTAWPVKVTGGVATPLVWNVVSTLKEDGGIELRAQFTNGTTSGHTQTTEVTLDRDAGNAPSSGIATGEVNLLTGDFTLTEPDASAFSVQIQRTFSSRTNDTDTEGQAEIFGPGWTSSIKGEESGSFTQLRKTSDTSVEILDADGSSLAFTAAARSTWAPQPGHESLVLTGTLSGNSFTLKDNQANVSVFTKAGASATTWPLASTASAVDDTQVTFVSETVAAAGRQLARPKYVISPSEAVTAAQCQADPARRGCRVVEFVYGDRSTASGDSLGDRQGQVQAVRLWATAPGAAASTAEVISRYAYDAKGLLREVWDPRIGTTLKTAYAYDSDGRVSTLTEGGQLPWTFTYGKAGSALTAGAGMLLKASRPTLAEGSATTTSGTAATTVVYDVPIATDRAPHRMDKATVATWGQDNAPTDATALFPAGSTPVSSTGSDLKANDYAAATITYLNADGEETNTASPGGSITTTEYDAYGNTVAELSGSNREIALRADDDTAAALGLTDLSGAERAERLASTSVYSADGERLLHEYGPLHLVTLTGELTGITAEATLPAGSVVPARAHNSYVHDENRPADAAVSDQVTTTATGAAIEGYAKDADLRTASVTYDWATGQVLSGKDGTSATARTAYDAKGRVLSTRTAGSDGSDAGTLRFTYYTAEGSGDCAARPEWAGMLCRTAPAASVTGGGGNPKDLITTRYTYDRSGQVATRSETANGSTRVTTIVRDTAGRTVKTSVVGGIGEAVEDTTFTYDKATGQPATRSAGGQTIAYAYDALSRPVSYDDGTGNTTTTAYDVLDRPVRVTDSAPSTVTYAYNAAGQVKEITDSVAGSFGATYDADGRLTGESLPGGYTLTVTTDTAGKETGKEYTDQAGTPVLSDVMGTTVHGDQAQHTQTDGSTTESAYTYDATGRLATATDTTAGGCTTRVYTFDANSNRTALTTTSDDCDSGTDDTTRTTASSAYDSGDRLTATGIEYDAFGRTTTSGANTMTYYANDLVRSESTADRRTVRYLDAAGRLARSTEQVKQDNSTWADGESITSHFADDEDNPTWTASSKGRITRSVTGPGGRLSALTSGTGDTVLQLSNLHGDVAVQLPLDPAAAPVVQRYDEYGKPLDGTASATYGWLGTYQRDSGTASGVVLMGVRLYDSATGRFLSVDPVQGGNDNNYEYCRGNPVSCLDLSGEYSYGASYKIGYFYSSAKSVFKWMRNHFWVFPLTGCGSTLNKGERCNLAYGKGPVKVMKIYSTGWKFKSLKGHAEGKDKNIKFWLGKKYGILQLNVKAWGPNNTWCNRNKPCAKANNVFAKVMWGLFANNISWYAPRW